MIMFGAWTLQEFKVIHIGWTLRLAKDCHMQYHNNNYTDTFLQSMQANERLQ